MLATDTRVNVEEILDGLPFPAAKVQIITHAGENDASEEVMEMLRALPVQNYDNMGEINANLSLIKDQPGSENTWSSNAK